MNRLTYERENGIKNGYWSPNKKQELVDALAAYENTGITPVQMIEIDKMYSELAAEQKKHRWIPVEERLPENDDYILVSFKNFSIPAVARYEEDEEGGAFYPGDEEESYIQSGIIVNAWKPLPEPYKGEIYEQRKQYGDVTW